MEIRYSKKRLQASRQENRWVWFVVVLDEAEEEEADLRWSR